MALLLNNIEVAGSAEGAGASGRLRSTTGLGGEAGVRQISKRLVMAASARRQATATQAAEAAADVRGALLQAADRLMVTRLSG